ncbi:MAG: hypothetical protein AAFW70_05030 [Cyanobacteria bacterium J06635_10]
MALPTQFMNQDFETLHCARRRDIGFGYPLNEGLSGRAEVPKLFGISMGI